MDILPETVSNDFASISTKDVKERCLKACRRVELNGNSNEEIANLAIEEIRKELPGYDGPIRVHYTSGHGFIGMLYFDHLAKENGGSVQF